MREEAFLPSLGGGWIWEPEHGADVGPQTQLPPEKCAVHIKASLDLGAPALGRFPCLDLVLLQHI